MMLFSNNGIYLLCHFIYLFTKSQYKSVKFFQSHFAIRWR